MTNSESKYFTGEFKEICILFLPIALTTLSGSLVLLVERLFFALSSVEVMEAATGVIYIYSIFQTSCVVLAMMAQVFVGRHQGAQDVAVIGSVIWQFIWFSLLSTAVTVPLGYLCGQWYFVGTVIEQSALPYFHFLLFINFLYPLGASLSSFYIGRGRTQLILLATLGSNVLNLLLAYVLILGIEGIIPPLGLIGGAISNLVAQGLFCLILFWIFLLPKHARIYGTYNWHLCTSLFWECVHPGILRALNRISVDFCWASIAALMIARQGDYLLIWSLGSTIGLFLPFVGEAVCQALTTVCSNIVGTKNFQLLSKASLSGFSLVFIFIVLLGIPLVIFPEVTFKTLFPQIVLAEESVRNVFFGLWLTFNFATLAYIPVSLILAFKDTKFFLITGLSSWISSYLIMYLALEEFALPANQCWTVLSFSNLAHLLMYLWRAHWLGSQQGVLHYNT